MLNASFQNIDQAVLRSRAEYRNSQLELREIERAYGRFVPRRILDVLGSVDIKDVALGDSAEIKTTILFSDIRNFTALAEKLDAQESLRILNHCYAQYEAPISGHQGIIDKYLGDGVLAIFKSADSAVAAAVEMVSRVQVLNIELIKRGLPPLEVGVGINTGYVTLGVIGNVERLETTVIGDAVNVASRIEGLTKSLKCRILVSEATFLDLDKAPDFSLRFADRVNVRNRLRPISVYEVYDVDPYELKASKVAWLDIFDEAVASYHLGYIKDSRNLFDKYAEKVPDDSLARYYIERCDALLQKAESGKEAVDEEFVWQAAYDTGHTVIDGHHHKLVAMYGELRRAVALQGPRAVARVLCDLKSYTEYHFSAEAQLMTDYDYPLKLEHLDEHDHFTRRLNELVQFVETEGATTRRVIFYIKILLFDWLASHSSQIDRHLTNYIERKQKPPLMASPAS